ncbi:hypothetical protein QJS66_21965 [Kocuria rhizophila]|nr:hypothetical protein QJS66_21965 [Kocuria rhizophila]
MTPGASSSAALLVDYNGRVRLLIEIVTKPIVGAASGSRSWRAPTWRPSARS